MRKIKFLSLALAVTLIIHTTPSIPALAAPDTDSAAEDSTAEEETAAEEDSTQDSETQDALSSQPAEYIYINTPEEFLNFAQKCYLDSWSAGKIIVLEQDIDLTGLPLDMIPVFAGTFDGQGHTIQGFRPDGQGYVAGLFRYIREGGVVQNLTLKGNIQAVNEKECIGGLCGINYGTIKNCSFSGVVSGQNIVGGIAGRNETSGNITKCSVDGRITGYYSTGGVVGTNHGVITFCTNQADVNENSAWVEEDDQMGTGLFFSFQATDDSIELYSGVDTGGIAGYSDGLIERCSNNGKVGYEHTGYNIGGIAGRQSGTVLLCTNKGEVYGRKDIGGIVGQMEPDIEIDEGASLRNAVNKLHDLINKTIDDMQDSKNALKADLDNLNMYGDGVLASGNAVAGQLTNFVDSNVQEVQTITQRMEHIMDLLPDIMGDMSVYGDSFALLTESVNQLMLNLDYSSSLNNNAYNETDYTRLSLLSTVGGHLISDSLMPVEGSTVTITAVPDSDDYELKTISVTGADGSAINYSQAGDPSVYSFIMPAQNVRVEAEFHFKETNGAFSPLVDEGLPTSSPLVPTGDPSGGEGPGTGPLESTSDPGNGDESGTGSPESTGDPSNGGEGPGTGTPEPIGDPSNGEGPGTGTPEPIGDPSNGEGPGIGTPEPIGDPSNGSEGPGTGTPEPIGDPNGGEEPGTNPLEPAAEPGGEEEIDSPLNSSLMLNLNPLMLMDLDPEPSTADVKIILHSNLSGNASCTVDQSTATLTVTPDTGYFVDSAPVVTDSSGAVLPVSSDTGISGQYRFSVDTASSPIKVEITFSKQTQQSTLDSSVGSINASMQDLRDNSAQINECIQTINGIMSPDGTPRSWNELSADEQDTVINCVSDMTGCLGQMSTSSASVLSGLSSIYNILDPYVQNTAETTITDNISQATQRIQDMITSLRSAYNGIHGIIGYMNSQPDIQFAVLGSGFDSSREDLHNQLLGISDSLKSLSGSASQYSDLVNEDLRAVNDQLNVVFNLLADHLTETDDISIEELYEEADESEIDSITSGRVDSCTNNGIVKGDINIGGIAGSMSVDEEDPEDSAAGSIDYQVGRRFITKCIITHGINNGYITAKKDGAGGIVGYMKHGIVADCESYGSAESTEGDYVGGIAGESLTDIRRCYSLCSVSGGKDIGGIAGYASSLKDCRAIVSVQASVGRSGAIAGETASIDDGSVSGNYYVGDFIHGINDISYVGIAEPVTYNELLAMEYLPTHFWHLTVTYRVEDTYLGTQEVKYGDSLADLDYPKIPDKDGCYGVWPDYSDQIMTGNLLIDGSYEDIVTVVESSEKTDDTAEVWQKPYALVEEAFTQDTILNASLSDQTPPVDAVGHEYVVYDVALENADIDAKKTFAIRLINPYENTVQVYGLVDGSWIHLDSKVRGQYLQVEMTGPEESFCIIADKSFPWIVIAAAAAGIIALFLIVRLLRRIKTKRAARSKRQTPES